MKTDIFYKAENDVVGIRADPAIIDDLIMVLESLLSIAYTVKTKARYESLKAQEKREKDMALNMAKFQVEAINIYRRYQEHLNNGCNGQKSLAIQKIKQEFKLGYTDADIFISEGRKALRERSKVKHPGVSMRDGVNGLP